MFTFKASALVLGLFKWTYCERFYLAPGSNDCVIYIGMITKDFKFDPATLYKNIQRKL